MLPSPEMIGPFIEMAMTNPDLVRGLTSGLASQFQKRGFDAQTAGELAPVVLECLRDMLREEFSNGDSHSNVSSTLERNS